MSYLTYQDDGGQTVTVSLASGVDPDAAAARLVPAGRPYEKHPGSPPIAAPTLAERRAAAVLPREAFAENAATAGIITWEEAANWTAGNALPGVVQPLMDATPAGERGRLTFTLLARRNVRRAAPEIVALGSMLGMTDAQVDALFGL